MTGITQGPFRLAAFFTFAVLARGATLPSPWSPAQGIRDAQGNLYVVGSVTSDTIPVTAGAFQTKFNTAVCGQVNNVSCRHIFAAKLSPDGSTILWATYIEGSQDDIQTSYAVDATGHLFIAGDTDSTDFPVTGTLSSLPPSASSGGSSFLLELSADGSRIIFAHKFGASLVGSGDGIYAAIGPIGLDGQGGLYAAGVADGTAFPTTPSAFMHTHNPASTDVFVFKLDIASDSIVYSTLFGGSGEEVLAGFAVDTAGHVCLSGYTLSKDLPVTPGSYQVPGPLINIFLAKLDSSGSSLVFSSLFAGSSLTYLGPMAVDSAGFVYIGGADSTGMLQTSPGAFQSIAIDPLAPGDNVAGGQGYVAKFDAATGAQVFLTYLADGGAFFGGLIAPATDGSVWISLETLGPVLSRPVIMSADALAPCVPAGAAGGHYPYVKHVSADGTEQLYGTFLTGIVSLSGNGTVQVYDSTSGFQTIDLTAPQPPHVTCVANAATFLGQGIAPGEAVTIFGPGIGPDQPQSFQLTSAGTVSTNLGGLQVFIGGLAAPILYASKNQIDAVVPFGEPTEGSVSVAVSSRGASIGSLTTTATSSNPGIFTADGTGTGQGAIFNADGSLNSRDNPASAGSFVTIYVTGLGPLSPTPVDGSIPQAARAQATLPIQVNGSSTNSWDTDQFDVPYAGDIAGEVEGIQEIHIVIPAGNSATAVSDWITFSSGPQINPIWNQVLVYYY